jgi:hypothetical protein
MSKSVLIGAVAASVLAVGTIAALTATVIVDESGGDGGRILRVAPSSAPGPGLPLPGPGRGRQGSPGPRSFEPSARPMRDRCLERLGVVPGSTPSMVTPDELRACMGLRRLR